MIRPHYLVLCKFSEAIHSGVARSGEFSMVWPESPYLPDLRGRLYMFWDRWLNVRGHSSY